MDNKASVSIAYTCGCGFTTHDLQHAIEHAENTRHILTVQGTIQGPRIAQTFLKENLYRHPDGTTKGPGE